MASGYPPEGEGPKPGWWLASDGKWYPPRKARRDKVTMASTEAPTARVARAPVDYGTPTQQLWAARRQANAAAIAPTATKPWWFAAFVVAGGALMAIGSPLPWVTVSVLIASISVNGTNGRGDGWVTLGIGALLLLVGAALWGRRQAFWRVPPIIVALGDLGCAIYEVVNISNFSQRLPKGPTV